MSAADHVPHKSVRLCDHVTITLRTGATITGHITANGPRVIRLTTANGWREVPVVSITSITKTTEEPQP